MGNRYKLAFKQIDRAGSFIPFTVLGWPDRACCLETIKMMIKSGATALELGLAFSDPVADGPIIQKASFETLEAGFSVRDALALIADVRHFNATIPIGVLTYLNVVLAQGTENFFAAAAKAGLDSVLIADLPPAAAPEVEKVASAHGISLVFIITPLTSNERLTTIASLSSAYIYVVSRLGITGTEERHDQNLAHLLERAKSVMNLPLLVGFGISSPAAAREMMTNGADGVITGSKIIEIIRNDKPPEYPLLKKFLQEMNEAVRIIHA
jgi:tryptophan synthase alpha chain